MNEYPAVLDYLSRFRHELAARWEPRHGQCEWYELRPCDYYGQFETPKIVYPDIAKAPEFAYDTSGSYGGNTMYIIPTDDLYLLGVLNSSTIAFLYPHLASTIRGDYLRFIASYMEQLPIPEPTAGQRASISALVRSLLAEGPDGREGRQFERDLNGVVYEVYRLNQEEICLLEEQLAARARRRDLRLVTGSLDALTGGEE